MKYREIEFKYLATDISLAEFSKICQARQPEKSLVTSGWDTFYDSLKDPGAFVRHRREPGKFNQLSFKRKTTDKNNFIRTEHNIDLATGVQDHQVEAMLAEFGHRPNTSIFKTCFIYTYSDHILCYYVVYDKHLRELDRFVEIEVAEDYPWPTEQAAWDRLTTLEAELISMGINPRSRTKLSLYERFSK